MRDTFACSALTSLFDDPGGLFINPTPTPQVGIRHVDLYLHMMSQPPWDTGMEMKPGLPFYILHYTYGMDYTLAGVFTPGKYGEWRFDKRSYSGGPPPRKLGQPPAGMKNDLVRFLINAINEATDALPCWDEYVKTGKVAPCTAAAGNATATVQNT